MSWFWNPLAQHSSNDRRQHGRGPGAAFARAAAGPIARVLSLRSEERWFVALAWFAVPAVRASIATLGLKRAMGLGAALARRPVVRRLFRDRNALRDVARARALTEAAHRNHWLGGACLHQAVTQRWLHELQGTPTALVIGVDAETRTGLDAHAWVEPVAQDARGASLELVPFAFANAPRASVAAK